MSASLAAIEFTMDHQTWIYQQREKKLTDKLKAIHQEATSRLQASASAERGLRSSLADMEQRLQESLTLYKQRTAEVYALRAKLQSASHTPHTPNPHAHLHLLPSPHHQLAASHMGHRHHETPFNRGDPLPVPESSFQSYGMTTSVTLQQHRKGLQSLLPPNTRALGVVDRVTGYGGKTGHSWGGRSGSGRPRAPAPVPMLPAPSPSTSRASTRRHSGPGEVTSKGHL